MNKPHATASSSTWIYSKGIYRRLFLSMCRNKKCHFSNWEVLFAEVCDPRRNDPMSWHRLQVRLEKIIEEIEHCLLMDPDDLGLRLILLLFYWADGDRLLALPKVRWHIRIARKQAPGHPMILAFLGEVQAFRGLVVNDTIEWRLGKKLVHQALSLTHRTVFFEKSFSWVA